VPPHPLRLTARDVTPRPAPAKGGLISRKVAQLIGAVVDRWYPDQAFVGREHRAARSEQVTVNNYLVMQSPAPAPLPAQRDAEMDAALLLLNSVANSPRKRARVRIDGDKWDGAPAGGWTITIEQAPGAKQLTGE